MTNQENTYPNLIGNYKDARVTTINTDANKDEKPPYKSKLKLKLQNINFK